MVTQCRGFERKVPDIKVHDVALQICECASQIASRNLEGVNCFGSKPKVSNLWTPVHCMCGDKGYGCEGRQMALSINWEFLQGLFQANSCPMCYLFLLYCRVGRYKLGERPIEVLDTRVVPYQYGRQRL